MHPQVSAAPNPHRLPDLIDGRPKLRNRAFDPIEIDFHAFTSAHLSYHARGSGQKLGRSDHPPDVLYNVEHISLRAHPGRKIGVKEELVSPYCADGVGIGLDLFQGAGE